MCKLTKNLDMLNDLNFTIARLLKEKDLLEKEIVQGLGHDASLSGQKTYSVKAYKAVVKTGFNYRVIKDEFNLLRGRLADCFNPVKLVESLRVDNKIMKDISECASDDEKGLVSQFIVATPKKLSLQVMAAI